MRNALRWTSSAALVLGGLCCLYLALFHAWLTATPTPRPQWHRVLSLRFGLAALVCFVLAGVIFAWLARPRSVRK